MINSNGNNLAFIFSLPRSGSTLLSLLMNNHSDVMVPPEPWFLMKLSAFLDFTDKSAPSDARLLSIGTREFLDNECFFESARAFAYTAYNTHLARTGKRHMIDKTPRYYHILEFIDQLFPQSRKIWLVRNPLDVIVSYMDTWKVGLDNLVGEKPTPHTLDLAKGLYLYSEYFSWDSEYKYSLRYEDLTLNPKLEITKLCEFMGVEFEENMLHLGTSEDASIHKSARMGDTKIFNTDMPHSNSVNRWKEKLNVKDLNKILQVTGVEIFKTLGYEDTINHLYNMGLDTIDEETSRIIRENICTRCIQGTPATDSRPYSSRPNLFKRYFRKNS